MSDFNSRALDLVQKTLAGRVFDRESLFSACRTIERDLREKDEFAVCVPCLVDNPDSDDIFRLGIDRAPQSLVEFAGQTDAILIQYRVAMTDRGMTLSYLSSEDKTPKPSAK